MLKRITLLTIIGMWLGMACSDSGSGSDDGDTTSGISSDSGSAADSATNTEADTASSGDSATAFNGDSATTSSDDSATSSSDDSATASGDTADSTSDTVSDTATVDSETATDTGTSGGTDPHICIPVPCAGKTYACADCIDNDSDSLVDAADPDCLGPCDNNESGFNIDIDGSAPGNCGMDCYFDDNNGNGDDECLWDFRCDTDDQHYKENNPDAVCSYEPNAVHEGCETLLQEQTTVCKNVCEHLVPNGCDCWGCCEIKGAYRYIGTPGCDLQHLDNCDPCTPVPSCQNECGVCELCIGETTLPDYCLTAIDTETEEEPVDTATTTNPEDTDTSIDSNDTASSGDSDSTGDTADTENVGDSEDTEDTPVYLRCPDGRQPCGQIGDADCAAGKYCLTGCCTAVIVE